MTKIPAVINFKQWIEDNRHLLKPPVSNKTIYDDGFIVMVVGGPNSRKDYHLNKTPEFFYQIEGNITLKLMVDGQPLDVHIKEGEIFYLPKNVLHSPQRGPNTIGLVIEQAREDEMEDDLAWFCENCNHLLYQESYLLENIETDMNIIFDKFYSNKALRTCDECGTVMEPPK